MREAPGSSVDAYSYASVDSTGPEHHFLFLGRPRTVFLTTCPSVISSIPWPPYGTSSGVPLFSKGVSSSHDGGSSP